MSIRVVPKTANLVQEHARTRLQGANERVLLTDFKSVFIFFSDTFVSFLIFDQSFQKQKGGPFVEKSLKKWILTFDTSKEPP